LIAGARPGGCMERQGEVHVPRGGGNVTWQACFETCENVTYSAARPGLVRAYRPLCCAAVVFTRKVT
jgi:hypothetical protein